MPKADWKDILDATREKTGENDLLRSGDVGQKIRSISSGGGDAVGEYDLHVSFCDYNGEPFWATGYYTISGGPVHYFDSASAFDLIDAVSAGSIVEIVIANPGSPLVSGSGCTASDEMGITEIDGVECYICEITVKNFTGDASVTYRET